MTPFSLNGKRALVTGANTGIGQTAVFLASSAAKYSHGAIINIDGGWLAR